MPRNSSGLPAHREILVCLTSLVLFMSSQANAQAGGGAGGAGGAASGGGAPASGAPQGGAPAEGAPAGSASGAETPKGGARGARGGARGTTTGGAIPQMAAPAVNGGGVSSGQQVNPNAIAPEVKGGAVSKSAAGARNYNSGMGGGSFSIAPPVTPYGNVPNGAMYMGPSVYGYGGNMNPYAPFIPSQLPVPPTMTQNQPYFGLSNFQMPQASASSSTGSMITSCLQGLASNLNGYQQMSMLQATLDSADEKLGAQEYPGWRQRGNSRAYYSSLVNGLNGQQAGCQQFVQYKDGQMLVGHWGRVALEEMKNHEDIYKHKMPTDIGKYCRSFATMDENTRLHFWLWFLGSVSAPESSCNPGAVGRGPNGNAIGLFQLEPAACAKVNMYVSESDLQIASVNIRCAVRLFARELRLRPTIMIGTSRGELGTYWGTLRNDNHNLARGADIEAHLRTENRLRQNPDCKN